MKTFGKTQGAQVVTLAEGAVVGKLDDFQFDLETGRIYGYRIKAPGVWSRGGGVEAGAVTMIGRDVVFVVAERVIEWSGSGRNEEEGRAWASTWRGTKVMSRRGEALGEVTDFVIEAAPPHVRALILDGNRIVGLEGRASLGEQRVVLEEPSIVQALPEETSDTESGWWRSIKGIFADPEE